ncbi:MAG: MATE family efflux transporter [Oscillospiraceae bacterium]|nr:MATE family efflux transporter [Oscillospiraceae bacterium]
MQHTDLTQGSVSRQLIRYALPVVATQLLQAVYSLVDMLIVSRLIGSAGVSGVSNASQTIHVLTMIAIGLSNGGNIMVGQYYGSHDEKNRTETTGSFFTLFGLLGVVFAAGSFLLARPFLVFLRAPAFEEALAYLRIGAFGLLFVFGYNALAAVMRAVGNSRVPMVCILVSSLLNIALDLLFVGPLHMGTAGAAAATVISQAVSFLLALLYLLRADKIFRFTPENMRMHADKIRQILKVGVPCAIQMSIAGFSWLAVTYLINDYGIVWSAANGFSSKIKEFLLQFIHAVVTASSSMIAQNLGAQAYDRAEKTLRTGMVMTLSMAAVFIVLVEIFAQPLMRVFTNETDVVAAGALNLRIEIVSQIFYAVFLMYHSLMLGAGDSWWVLLSSFCNCILFRLIFSFIFESLWGVAGVFIACAAAPIVSIPIGYYYKRSGRWRKSLAAGQT